MKHFVTDKPGLRKIFGQKTNVFRVNRKTALLMDQTSYLYQISEEFSDYLSGASSRLEDEFLNEIKILEQTGFHPSSVDNQDLSLNEIVLTLMYGCNMACTYCCVGPGGDYGRPTTTKMVSSVALRAIDFLLENTTSRILRLGFFGGEPLINWKTIKECLEYTSSIKGKKWHYSLVTNGTLITEDIARTLSSYDIKTVITIDGTRSSHDKQRPLANGNPSYDLIVRNIEVLKRHSAHFHLKCVYTKDFPMGYDEAREHLEAIAGDYGSVTVAFENGSFKDKDMKSEYFKKKLEMAVEDRRNINNMRAEKAQGDIIRTIMQILTGRKLSNNMCPAGIGSVEIAPNGDIYACHIAEYIRDFRGGNIFTGFSDDYYKNRQRFLTPLKSCKTCWAQELCVKECNMNRVMMTDKDPQYDADPEYCESSMSIIREAIDTILNLNSGRLSSLIQNCPARDKKIIMDAYETKEILCGSLKHIKPCFLFPADNYRSNINWTVMPA